MTSRSCATYAKEGNKFKVCGVCKSMWYCDRECQLKDWKKHKIVCSKPEERNVDKYKTEALDRSEQGSSGEKTSMKQNKTEFSLLPEEEIKSTIEFDPFPNEQNFGFRVEGTLSKKLVATRDLVAGELVGQFNPLATFHYKDHQLDPILFFGVLAHLLKTRIVEYISGIGILRAKFLRTFVDLWPRTIPSGDSENAAMILTKQCLDRIRLNSFKLEDLVLLYQTPSFINHSCASNTVFRGLVGSLVSLVPIKAGDEITICYAVKDSTQERQGFLETFYGFTCKCALCISDGSFFSWFAGQTALKCVNCLTREGNIKRCRRCGFAFYCSAQCQKNHWKIHKPVCSRVKEIGY